VKCLNIHVLSACALLLSCGQRHTATIPASAPGQIARFEPFVDLEPGWRIRAVVPLGQSGRMAKPELKEERSEGNTITLRTGKDFAGYETQFYRVTRGAFGGLHLHFETATITRDQQTRTERQPTLDLFPARRAAQLRLLFLERASSRDHDMAVLAARNRGELVELTRKVQADPGACREPAGAQCFWIPAGVAVRAERLDPKSREWTPVL
jgi:hypothetical protein